MTWSNIGRERWNTAIEAELKRISSEAFLDFLNISRSFFYVIARRLCIEHIENLQTKTGQNAQQNLNVYIQQIQEAAWQEVNQLMTETHNEQDWVAVFSFLRRALFSGTNDANAMDIKKAQNLLSKLNAVKVFSAEMVKDTQAVFECILKPTIVLHQRCMADFRNEQASQIFTFLQSWKDQILLGPILPLNQDTFAFDCSYERLGELVASHVNVSFQKLTSSGKTSFLECVWFYFIQSFELERLTFKKMFQNPPCSFDPKTYPHQDLDDYALVRTQLMMGPFGNVAVPPVSYLFFFCSVIAKPGSELFVVNTPQLQKPSENYSYKLHALLTQHGCYAAQTPDKVGQIVLGFDEMSRVATYSGGQFVLFPKVRDFLMGNGPHQMVIGALHAVSFPSKKDETALKTARSTVGLELWDNNNLLTHQTLLEDRLRRVLTNLPTTTAFGWFFKQPDFFSIPSVQRILMSDWEDVGVEVQQDEIVRTYIRMFRLSETSSWRYSVFISKPLYQETTHPTLGTPLYLFADQQEIRNVEGFTAYPLQAMVEDEEGAFTGIRIIQELLLNPNFDFCLPRRFRDNKRVPFRKIRDNEYVFSIQEAKLATHFFDFGTEQLAEIIQNQELVDDENEPIGYELIIKDAIVYRNHILVYPFARPTFELFNNKIPVSPDKYQLFFEYQFTQGVHTIIADWSTIENGFTNRKVADCRVYVVLSGLHLKGLNPGQRDTLIRQNSILVEDIRLKQRVEQSWIQNPTLLNSKYFVDCGMSEELRFEQIGFNDTEVEPIILTSSSSLHKVNQQWSRASESHEEVRLDNIKLFQSLEDIVMVYLENRKKHQMPMIGNNPWKTMMSIARSIVADMQNVDPYVFMTYLMKVWADQGRIIPRQQVSSNYPSHGQRKWSAPEDIHFVDPYLTRYKTEGDRGHVYVLSGFTNDRYRQDFLKKLQNPSLKDYVFLQAQTGADSLRVSPLIRFKLHDDGLEVLAGLFEKNQALRELRKNQRSKELPIVDAKQIDLNKVSKMILTMRRAALDLSTEGFTIRVYYIRKQHNVAPQYWIRLPNRSDLESPYLCTRDKEDFMLVLSALYPAEANEFLNSGEKDVRCTGLHPFFATTVAHLSGAAPAFLMHSGRGVIQYCMNDAVHQKLLADIQSVQDAIKSTCTSITN